MNEQLCFSFTARVCAGDEPSSNLSRNRLFYYILSPEAEPAAGCVKADLLLMNEWMMSYSFQQYNALSCSSWTHPLTLLMLHWLHVEGNWRQRLVAFLWMSCWVFTRSALLNRNICLVTFSVTAAPVLPGPSQRCWFLVFTGPWQNVSVVMVSVTWWSPCSGDVKRD